MSDTTTVKIGMSSARELELEMDETADVAKAFTAAIEAGDSVLWLTDATGHSHGIVVAGVAFVEIERAQRREVGFAGSG